MIQVYKHDNQNYDYNGDAVLHPISCQVSMTLNGSWELEVEVPADERGDFRMVCTGSVIAAPTPVGEKQLWRIYDHDISDTRAVGRARPIFMDSAREVFLEDVRPTDCIGQTALDRMMAGTKYRGLSNIQILATAYYIRKNLIEALASNDENSFLNRWGGEISYDNYTVIINTRQGEDRGLRVSFGRNITAIHEKGNADQLATRLYPVAFNGRTIEDGDPYVDSPKINDYPIVYTSELKCEDIKLREDLEGQEASEGDTVCETLPELYEKLRERCREKFAAGIDTLTVSYDIDLVDLAKTPEYEQYKALEHVELGDTVHCYHSKLGIVTDARVTQVVYDPLTGKNQKVVLGDYQKDYFERLDEKTGSVDGKLEEAKKDMYSVVKNASDKLNEKLAHASGLYCTAQRQPDGSTIYLLHDKETLDESTYVIKLTAEAIGFSTDGGKSYPYGFTLTGEMVAAILSANGVNADWINTGTLNLAKLILSGTLGGMKEGYGSTKDGRTTKGLLIWGPNGLDASGNAIPPYSLLTNAGWRVQSATDANFNVTNKTAQMVGNISATGNISAGGNITATGNVGAENVDADNNIYIGKDLTVVGPTFAVYDNATGGHSLIGYNRSSGVNWIGSARYGLVVHCSSFVTDYMPTTSSDREKKKDIEALEDAGRPAAAADSPQEGPSIDGDPGAGTSLAERYMAFMAALTPVRYRYKTEPDDAPLHVGYIWQDAEAALTAAGLTRGDMAALGETVDDTGGVARGIAYGELIPLLHLLLRRQEERIRDLEARITTLEGKGGIAT